MTESKVLWYQEPFVWLVIFFPALAIVMGFGLFYLAVVSNDGLVVDDYYKQGLEINRVLARDQAATQHQLQANLRLLTEQRLVELSLTAKTPYSLPKQLTLNFIYQSRAGVDKTTLLQLNKDNVYTGNLPELVKGTWDVQLLGDDWRLLGVMRVPTLQEVRLVAAIL